MGEKTVAPLSWSTARLQSTTYPLDEGTPAFTIDSQNKSFKHQYANIYFLRLRFLRGFVEAQALRRWQGISGSPTLVPRVLEVPKGKICYIVGTVYLDMSLKPNVLEDLDRDRSLPAPPNRPKIYSADDAVNLEDESGRIRLVGERVNQEIFVTGIIAAVLGVETPSGDFEVVDVCFAGLAPHDPQDENDGINTQSNDSPKEDDEEYLAVVSGLDVGSPTSSELQHQLLAEFLSGETDSQTYRSLASRITRLIVAGNSMASFDMAEDEVAEKQGVGTPCLIPIHQISAHLTDISHSMPIHLLAGATDPSGVIMPQQPLPRAMFGGAPAYATFSCETNPTYIRLKLGTEEKLSLNGSSPRGEHRTILVTSGQPLSDLLKYVPDSPTIRLALAESTLRWRHIAPTAPDTLWCHPFFTVDPFVLHRTPHIYIHGCQSRFETRLVKENGVCCRIVLVPSFAESGTVVLIGLRSLKIRTVHFTAQQTSNVV